MNGDSPAKYQDECFFIAPIGDDDSPTRKRSDGVMNFIVKKAAQELALNVVRADQISSPGQINLQVIEHVIGARAAVADLTDLNANVFYEMAVRHTAKLPLVLIAERETKLPFDIAQMRTIFFSHTDLEDADRCRAQIVDHLREALDGGVVDSPISSAVDLSNLASGGAADRSIAELVTTVEGLARGQRDLTERFSDFASIRGTGSVPSALLRDLVAVEEYLELLNSGEEGEAEATEEAMRRLRMAIRYLDRRTAGGYARKAVKPLPELFESDEK